MKFATARVGGRTQPSLIPRLLHVHRRGEGKKESLVHTDFTSLVFHRNLFFCNSSVHSTHKINV